MEPRADLEQRSNAPLQLDLPGGLGGNARENLEQRGLACAIAPDDAEHLATLDLEGDVPQGEDVVGALRGVESRESRVEGRGSRGERLVR